MVNDIMFSSKSGDWETPQWLFDHYNSIFNFDLDVCADSNNTKCDHYISKELDGLTTHWAKRNWMNSPYGNEISKWIKKAYEESLKGNLVCCLLPARPDTRWWHDYVMKADAIHYIRGRLKFSNQTNSAPFPSCVVIFGLFEKRL